MKRSSEVYDLVYAKSTFLFHTPEPLLLFTSFLPLSTLHTITSIHFDARRAIYEPFDTHDFETPLHYMPRSIRRSHKTAQYLSQPHLNTVADLDGEDAKACAEYRHDEPSVWGAACEMLEWMKGLRELRVGLTMKCFECLGLRHHPWDLVWEDQGGSEKFVIQPLVQIVRASGERLRVFEVEVDWPERRVNAGGRGWGFKVRRREIEGEQEGWYWLAR